MDGTEREVSFRVEREPAKEGMLSERQEENQVTKGEKKGKK